MRCLILYKCLKSSSVYFSFLRSTIKLRYLLVIQMPIAEIKRVKYSFARSLNSLSKLARVMAHGIKFCLRTYVWCAPLLGNKLSPTKSLTSARAFMPSMQFDRTSQRDLFYCRNHDSDYYLPSAIYWQFNRQNNTSSQRT